MREYDLETLRDSVAVVLQKNVLFSGTILENLRWGNQDATEEECRAACRAACADEFIERLPHGYHTFLERGGTNVSGGQKQRLCIARALLKNPRILILDDSTSAVDTATDARIREAFGAAIPGTTKIIIAQRISSVQHADHILVIEDGRINGYGTHDQLVRSNEIYREIYESQSRGGGDFDQVQAENAGKEECGMMEDRQSSLKKQNSGQAQSSRKEQTGRQAQARETKEALRSWAASSGIWLPIINLR